MGEQPALRVKLPDLTGPQPRGVAADHAFPRQPRLAELIGPPAIEQAEFHLLRPEGGGHEIFGKAFDIPGRIGLPGGGKHMVMGIFVQQC